MVMSNSSSRMLERVLELMQEKGWKVVEASFDGHGDEGYVNRIVADGKEVDGDPDSGPVAELVYEVATWDWWNDEGGGGKVTVRLAGRIATVEGYYYVEETRPVPTTVVTA